MFAEGVICGTSEGILHHADVTRATTQREIMSAPHKQNVGRLTCEQRPTLCDGDAQLLSRENHVGVINQMRIGALDDGDIARVAIL